MYQPTELPPRRRRYWTEALLVAGILAFGGFALLSDARLTPDQLVSGISDIVGN